MTKNAAARPPRKKPARGPMLLIAGAVFLVAGIGYGTRLAGAYARAAARAGADGLLAMPPPALLAVLGALFSLLPSLFFAIAGQTPGSSRA